MCGERLTTKAEEKYDDGALEMLPADTGERQYVFAVCIIWEEEIQQQHAMPKQCCIYESI